MNHDQDVKISKIAGNIVVSPQPGPALKLWRKRLGVSQSMLAKEMFISPSVLSDYENGRRQSPGVRFLKKYIECLVKLDKTQILNKAEKTEESSAIISIGEFKVPHKASELIEIVNGELLAGEDHTSCNIYGYTILDSIRTIYALSGFDFYSIFGATTERIIVFTKVGMGRSPLVAIRVSQLKPRMVVLHSPAVVDSLAIDLAQKENIILVRSTLTLGKTFTDIFKNL